MEIIFGLFPYMAIIGFVGAIATYQYKVSCKRMEYMANEFVERNTNESIKFQKHVMKYQEEMHNTIQNNLDKLYKKKKLYNRKRLYETLIIRRRRGY